MERQILCLALSLCALLGSTLAHQNVRTVPGVNPNTYQHPEEANSNIPLLRPLLNNNNNNIP
ncbi:Hypothetical protein FKW44_008253, partial [Caligus rogercresseyi]